MSLTPGRFIARDDFNPPRIFLKILFFQSTFYLAYGFCLLIGDFILGIMREVSLLQQLFSSSSLTWAHVPGIACISAFIVASIIEATTVVATYAGRARRVWDFTITIFLIHFALCWIYDKKPCTKPVWWMVVVGSWALMTWVAELICLRREMLDIPVGRNTPGFTNNSSEKDIEDAPLDE